MFSLLQFLAKSFSLNLLLIPSTFTSVNFLEGMIKAMAIIKPEIASAAIKQFSILEFGITPVFSKL